MRVGERGRRGCICFPPPIGADDDRVKSLGSEGADAGRQGTDADLVTGGSRAGVARTRLVRNRHDRRTLVRLRGSRYWHWGRGGRRQIREGVGALGAGASGATTPQSPSAPRKPVLAPGSRRAGGQMVHRADQARPHGRIKSGRSRTAPGLLPGARFGRNQDGETTRGTAVGASRTSIGCSFFARAGARYGRSARIAPPGITTVPDGVVGPDADFDDRWERREHIPPDIAR